MNVPTTPLPPPPPPRPALPPLPPPPAARATVPLEVTGPRRGPLGVSGVLWRVLAAILVLAGLWWGVLQVVTVLAHDERVETETFPAAEIDALVVDSANGRVRIVASETTVITVRAEISDGLRATGESRRVLDGTLMLSATCPTIGSDFCWVDYEVSVPPDLPITVSADNGRIEVTGSEGTLRLNGGNGSVVLDDVSGVLDVSTDNGRVEATDVRSTDVVADSDNGSVELTFVAPPESVRATTENGRVEVVVPNDGTAYRAELDTDNGREELAVPTDPAAPRSLVLTTDHGNVIARTG